MSYLKINNFQAKPIYTLPPPKEVVLTYTINMAINIWGIKIDLFTIKQIVDIIEENIASKRLPMQITGVNSEIIIKSLNNKSLQLAINESDIVNIDGISVVIGLRILGFQIKERAACPDIFDILIDRANAKGYKIFFLGAKEKVVKEMIRKLQEEYSDLQIVGFHNGYFNQENEIEIAKSIKLSNADILFLGISSPKKELFIRNYLKFMNVPICFGVGGVFDIKAGILKRAPYWMQKIGFEWFYRLIQEPQRMWYRYLVGNTKFIWAVLKEKVKGKNSLRRQHKSMNQPTNMQINANNSLTHLHNDNTSVNKEHSSRSTQIRYFKKELSGSACPDQSMILQKQSHID